MTLNNVKHGNNVALGDKTMSWMAPKKNRT